MDSLSGTEDQARLLAVTGYMPYRFQAADFDWMITPYISLWDSG